MANNDNNRGNPGQKRDEDGQFTSSNNRQGSRSDQGGQSKQAGSRNDNPGNFANDREKASEAGRKGGQNSHGGRSRDDE